MESILGWGTDLIAALQQVPWLAGAMLGVTWLGSEEFFLFVMPVVYWCVNRRLGAGLAVALIGSNALNSLLKLNFHLPRPYWVDARVRALASETTYGLPSGHAQHAVAVWGYLASQAGRARPALAWGLALVLIALISFSRVYLGMHFPVDVLGGWLAGAALLWALWRWGAPVAGWFRRLGLAPQVLVGLSLSLLYAALAAGALLAANAAADPPLWATHAALSQSEPIDPRNPENIATAAGMLLGLAVGLALAERWARFEAGGSVGRRALRFVIGVAGMLLFWRGLALIFPADPLPLALGLRYARYALTVIWALFLAPWLFMKLGLARMEGPPPLAASVSQRLQKLH